MLSKFQYAKVEHCIVKSQEPLARAIHVVFYKQVEVMAALLS